MWPSAKLWLGKCAHVMSNRASAKIIIRLYKCIYLFSPLPSSLSQTHLLVMQCLALVTSRDMSMYLLYVHIPENTRKILRTLLKEKTTNGRLGKLTLDSSVMKKTVAESKTKGKKRNPHATCMVNSCQGKVTISFCMVFP